MAKLERYLRVRISEELYKKLEKEAKAFGLSVSEMVRFILNKYFADKKVDLVVDRVLLDVLEDEELRELLKKKIREKYG